MNFSKIGYFITAAKHLNFTKAAHILYISQPSLSKQIAILEEDLGVQLFDRSKKNLQLTPAGKLMYSEFNRILPEIESIIQKVRQANMYNTLTIGCVESIALGDTATSIIRDFQRHHSEVELFFKRYDFETLHNMVADGSVDAAFTISAQLKKMKGILSVVIEKRKRYIIISANSRLAVKESLSFEDLRDEIFVLLDRDKSNIPDDEFFEKCRSHGFFPKIRYAPNNNTILDYLELDGYVALLDKSIEESRKGKLKIYPSSLDHSFSLVCIRKNDNKNPALTDFLKFLPIT